MLKKPFKKMLGEGESHYKARLIVYGYLKRLIKKFHNLRIKAKWPFFQGPRSDLAVVEIPSLICKIWVEVQDTPLSYEAWNNKLTYIRNMTEELYVVLTDNTIDELSMIRTICNKLKIRYKVFKVDLNNKTLVEL